MAMNDISTLISADKEAFLAFQDKSVASDDNASGIEFLSQLQSAHDTQAQIKKDAKSVDAEVFHVFSKQKQSENDEEIALNTDNTQVSDANTVTGDVMLEQINSSLAMSTSVAKVRSDSETLDPAATDKEYIQPSEDKKSVSTLHNSLGKAASNASDDSSIIKNTAITEKSDTAKLVAEPNNNSLNKLAEPKNDSSLAEDEALKGKTSVAQAVEAQLKPTLAQSSVNTLVAEKATPNNTSVNKEDAAKEMHITNSDIASKSAVSSNKNNADGDALSKQITPSTTTETGVDSKLSNLMTAATENEKKSAINALLAKDTSLVKADKVLASLTSEQLDQLNSQAKSINTADGENKNDKLSALKQLLAQFIVDNEKGQQESSKYSFSSQLEKLNMSEKNALLTQLNTYIKTQHPQGEQLSALSPSSIPCCASISLKRGMDCSNVSFAC